MSSFEDTGYLTQQQQIMNESSRNAMFTKTVGSGSMMSNVSSQQRRPDLHEILNPNPSAISH